MADVTVDVKISVKDLDKIEQIADKIKTVARVAKIEFEDVGFGIKVIRAKILVDDKVEGFDTVEDKIKKIEGVSEIDVLNMDRGF
ncbi:elongation factor 1-beta [Candidatus Micrarchaeota archaeon]|nr:elongation factor 1-beta [Candidatus Micrarchaeota archaeon]